MKHAGFTIVELVVVITAMGILFAIGSISFQNSQTDSRDNERVTDIESLKRGIETYYTNNVGSYPNTAAISSETAVTDMLSGVTLESLRAPQVTSGMSLKPATNATMTATGVLPQPSVSEYIYQPIARDNTLCTTSAQECRTYALYYRNERTNVVTMVKGTN